MLLLNILLGTLVVEIGFGLLWEGSNLTVLGGWALLVGAWLWSQARTVTQVWAWSTLLLGLESFAWPLILMVQLKASSVSPSDEEMGTILSAVVLGLFSAVFWISFSYGLFKRSARADRSGPEELKQPG